MPLDQPAAPAAALAEPARHDRPNCMAFIADAATDKCIHDALNEMMPGGVDSRRGGIRTAIAALQKVPTPRVLIVDVSGEEAPLAALKTLAGVAEPDVCLLVVGEAAGLDFYRDATRGAGIAEYLAKPVTREVVARHFGPLAIGRAPTGEAALGGKLLTVTGVRGGVGATIIALNLAWFFGVQSRRHTVLLDADLHLGCTAAMLNLVPGRGLVQALQQPQRIDSLLAERAAQPVKERLSLLASQTPLNEDPTLGPGAADALMKALRRRYSFIVADAPYRPLPFNRDLLDLSHRRILVMDPSLAAVRDAIRLMAMRSRTGQDRRPILVLNRLGMPGSLTRRQFEDALKTKVDIAIPDLPRHFARAATLATPLATEKTPFQAAIKALATEVAFNRLLDAADTTQTPDHPCPNALIRWLRGAKHIPPP